MSNHGFEKWRVAIFAYAPLLFWIGMIFFMSSDQASMPATSRFIRPLLEFLFPSASNETLQLHHFYIRKAAHFVAYALLGLLACRAFLKLPGNLKKSSWALASFVLVLLIAVFDEFNQSLSVSRAGSFYDVLLDLTGGLTAIGLVVIITLYFARKETPTLERLPDGSVRK